MTSNFDRTAERALDAVWGIALGVYPNPDSESDRHTLELRDRLRRLQQLALGCAVHGARLLGDRNPERRPDLISSVDDLPASVADLVDATDSSTDFADLDFVGRVCDVHREVVSVGLLD